MLFFDSWIAMSRVPLGPSRGLKAQPYSQAHSKASNADSEVDASNWESEPLREANSRSTSIGVVPEAVRLPMAIVYLKNPSTANSNRAHEAQDHDEGGAKKMLASIDLSGRPVGSG